MRQDEAAGPPPPPPPMTQPQPPTQAAYLVAQPPRGPPPHPPLGGPGTQGHAAITAAKPALTAASGPYPTGTHDPSMPQQQQQPPPPQQPSAPHGTAAATRSDGPVGVARAGTAPAARGMPGQPPSTTKGKPGPKPRATTGAAKPKKSDPGQIGARVAAQAVPTHPQGGGGPPGPPKQPQQLQPPRFSTYPAPGPERPQQPPQPPPAGGGGGYRELRVEDALIYLDQVKMEFKDRPQIYNQFLAIMKNFKTQEVDTPGVIKRVSQLFRGYNSLILGFNTFLPEGFKISLADLQRQEEEDRREQQEAEQRGLQASTVMQHPTQASAQPMQQGIPPRGSPASGPSNQGPSQAAQWNRPPPPYTENQGAARKPPPPPKVPSSTAQSQRPPAQPKGPAAAKSTAKASIAASAPPAQPPPVQHQAVEFDHAISYVTKIKRRFANDPSTYHSFLEILHTYQKEQRGIKEVLEQVAHLFQDHPDLLKEFTFFLPDAVQEQAKERLHRAAAESEARQAVSRQQQMEQYQQGLVPPGHGKFIDMTRTGQPMEVDSPPPPRGQQKKRAAPDGAPHPEVPAHPDSFVYNSAVERQFFDMARESLTSYTRDGGQAWAEFVKCLDMYAQDILSRTEMLNFVEPLLGKRNTKLFEEFKRILNAAGSPTQPLPLLEDSWHSVPLSEIDFTRCRRCSPSYRALPRDYPAPPCSGRSEQEAKILNDVWVSLPVGSEESYTFRHMRRNTYEETLFRVEDERFEIDMVIDSNAATLRRLEPIAEEIAHLAQEELCTPDSGAKIEGTGLGGRRFQYTFDKKLLGVINRNSVARIYGDSGQEMLELLTKNPTVAVPTVVQRLRQKDREWRIVRDRLNRHWKELAQHNYYKSLDHRSLTWRTFDKRATSTRTLLSEIKDRATNGGSEGAESLKQRLDKAKEEHGTFFEVTMKETLSKGLDLNFLPKPDRRLFTPHLSLMYDNNSWAQRDAYRILAFALERGHITPADKERCHRIWTDFLGPFFGLSLNWMQRPAAAYQESAAALSATTPVATAAPPVISDDDDEEESKEDAAMAAGAVTTEELRRDSDAARDFTDHHPLPAGTNISTLYGEGKVVEFRRTDHLYVVDLKMGARGYLRPATVLCSVLPVEQSAYTRELRAKDVSKLARPDDQLVIGTQSLYLVFRLHQILVRRLNIAKRLAYSVGGDRSLQTLVEQMPDDGNSSSTASRSSTANPQAAGRRRYEAYLSLVYALLDGGGGGAAEGGKYEDRVRGLLGHGAFELATMDKLISHIWKNVQSVAGDETMWNLVQLYRRQLVGGFRPESFRREAAYHSEGEPLYAFQYCPVQGNDSAVLHFEYLGVMEDSDGAEGVAEEDDDDVEEMEEDVNPGIVHDPPTKRARR